LHATAPELHRGKRVASGKQGWQAHDFTGEGILGREEACLLLTPKIGKNRLRLVTIILCLWPTIFPLGVLLLCCKIFLGQFTGESDSLRFLVINFPRKIILHEKWIRS
jgi:hypothetical protein